MWWWGNINFILNFSTAHKIKSKYNSIQFICTTFSFFFYGIAGAWLLIENCAEKYFCRCPHPWPSPDPLLPHCFSCCLAKNSSISIWVSLEIPSPPRSPFQVQIFHFFFWILEYSWKISVDCFGREGCSKRVACRVSGNLWDTVATRGIRRLVAITLQWVARESFHCDFVMGELYGCLSFEIPSSWSLFRIGRATSFMGNQA